MPRYRRVKAKNCNGGENGRLAPASVALLVIFFYPSEIDPPALVGDRRERGGFEGAFALAYVTATVDQQLLLRNEYLVAETGF